ncbi:SMC-Scp complex subunit ScpB [Corynebacterium sp. 153RC1]|uniref:SMC-Scp complex subunit ScpB n=1 Tax=unclassified Corynebacterium TaxID=2624378 RepID=UPI00211C2EBF|nr:MULTISPECIES: SMC-Scp complex subunit ScpB [unclassified Corynebacterium]MCQ9353411.1 SMC-Scp complex subunit ScpB [Corynebacterium sp. 209RC1]MCQ9355633.1 SMC-Scp complex subunit ScpB [Corynebacterium sp. 1222RC1]MCQ9357815.1 SMC-Scp complex subunit ScpB [Corynebacterium sp. 122RC1]MCQ9360010.1 SMC-Scp complex subunit ScpB [Corynebacterium sp. 142RC1]MCQ9362154.1 SMC-Scp complex subunit ScpB [Corynebacterium sp. 153RC1]
MSGEAGFIGGGEVRGGIEAILLVVDEPVSPRALAAALEVPEAEALAVLRQIAAEYEERESGMRLVETAGAWRWYTSREYAPVVEKFLLGGSQAKLSRAALETLAVIAYRQPATRAQVSAVRGVNVDGVMRTLALRGLIREVDMKSTLTDPEEGTAPQGGHGAQYFETTELFLELLGIDSLERLPNLAPLLPEIDAIEDY